MLFMAQVGFQSVKTFPSEHNFKWTFGLKGFSYVKVIFLMHKLMRVFIYIAWKVLSTVCP